MVLTIPKSFSRHATTLLDQHPQAMVLHYDTSAGHNFVASKMADSAVTSIRASVAQTITTSYAKTMFAAIKQLDSGLKTAATNNQKLATGGKQLQTANQKIATNLDTLAASSLKLKQGSQTMTVGLTKYINGVSQLQAGNQKVVAGLTQLLVKSNQLVAGIAQLSNGAQTLNQASANTSPAFNKSTLGQLGSTAVLTKLLVALSNSAVGRRNWRLAPKNSVPA